jgi:hypothetical protein
MGTVMDDTVELAIRFPDIELGAAGRAAQDLRAQLQDDVPHAAIELRRDDAANQDLGATLIAVLGTPALVVLAHGVAAWIKRRGVAVELEIEGRKTTLRAAGAIDDNTVKIIELLSRRHP